LGQERLLAKREAAGKREVSVANDDGSGTGVEQRRAENAIGWDRFFQSTQDAILQKCCIKKEKRLYKRNVRS